MENRNSTLVSEQNKFRLRPSENTPEIQQPDLSKTCTVGPPSPTHTREKKEKRDRWKLSAISKRIDVFFRRFFVLCMCQWVGEGG